ncbi:MAG TPA: xanthine dehydrogenase family protein molybdopterin-binding subunit [Vineibacter sp.]|nr:xanthine dehydrogenase family protein molybdopterin-binding subunit [Vineibacter sp.]
MLGRIDTSATASRRGFLAGAAAGSAALVVGFHWRPAKAQMLTADGALAPNAFVRIGKDNSVTVFAKHLEMGQGAHTGLATVLAEELDADWANVKVMAAPADGKIYGNIDWGGTVQGTGGSSSIHNSWMQLRKAGAAARAMLVAAAAKSWNVPVGQVRVERGIVSLRSGKRATFGELVELAAKETPPADPPLKDPKIFRLIGKETPRLDMRAKSTGTAVFAIDQRIPDALVAVVQRAPLFGAKVASFDATKAKEVTGVVDVVQIPAGVAVVASNTWAAIKGREALSVTWDDRAAEKRDSAAIMASYRELAARPGTVAKSSGDAEAAIKSAARTVEADFEFPYLAHAPMEPLTCVVRLSGDSCEIWAGDQFQTIDQLNAAKAAGLSPDRVVINTLFAGGSFGRRANPGSDYIVEGVSIAKATGKPIRLVWTREDDIRGGRYRPMYFHRLRAGLDAQGNIVGWQHRIVGQSIVAGTPFEGGLVKNGIDATSVEGASTLPYGIANLHVDLHTTQVGVPVLWWRSVGSTHTAYSTEVFMDELARAANKDPVALRRGLLAKHPRHLAVLNLAAEKAGWGKPLAKGKGRGIAVHESFNSYVAQVAEVTVDDKGKVTVDRVVCAVDCGIAVNPDVVRAQMEGGIGFGLSSIFAEAITLKGGAVEQSNFHDYTPLRIEQMPRVEVHILPSTQPPTGVGEPGVPPIGPAVANAIFAATGKRIRALPLASQGVQVS